MRTTRRRFAEDSDDDHGHPGQKGVAGPPPDWKGPGDVPFEDWLIKAELWIASAKTKPKMRGPLILRSLSGPPFESFNHLAKDNTWLTSETNAEDLLQKMDSPEYYGDDVQEHLLASLTRITYHMKRGKNEGWQEFFARWDSAMRKVREHAIELPELYVGFLLIQGLRLDETEIMNFTQGDIKPKSIKAWLRKSEAKVTISQLCNEVNPKKTPATSSSTVYYVDENVDQHDESYDQEAEEIETFLAEYDGDQQGPGPDDSLSEGEAVEVLATALHHKRSYAQSIKNKKYTELSRGYGKPSYDRTKGKGYQGGKGLPLRQGKYHVTIEEIKQWTRCKLCNEKGH